MNHPGAYASVAKNALSAVGVSDFMVLCYGMYSSWHLLYVFRPMTAFKNGLTQVFGGFLAYVRESILSF